MQHTHTGKRIVMLVLACGIVLTTGCGALDPRTSNQGGGSLLSAGSKLASGQLTSLTADEVQILGDTLSTFVPDAPDISLTDEQAEIIVEVLVENDLNSIEDALSLAQDPEEVVLPDAFLDLFSGFAERDAEELIVDYGSL